MGGSGPSRRRDRRGRHGGTRRTARAPRRGTRQRRGLARRADERTDPRARDQTRSVAGILEGWLALIGGAIAEAGSRWVARGDLQPRPWSFGQAADWLGRTGEGLLIIRGKPLTGKTGLIELLSQAEGLPATETVVAHDARAEPSLDALRQRVAARLAEFGDIAASTTSLHELAQLGAANGRPIAIAIDHLQSAATAASQLLRLVSEHAYAPAAGLRIIVTWRGEDSPPGAAAEALDLDGPEARAELAAIALGVLDASAEPGDTQARAVTYADLADGRIGSLLDLCRRGDGAVHAETRVALRVAGEDPELARVLAVLAAVDGYELRQEELLEILGPPEGPMIARLEALAVRGLPDLYRRPEPARRWVLSELLAHERRTCAAEQVDQAHASLGGAFLSRFGAGGTGAADTYLAVHGAAHVLRAGVDPDPLLLAGVLANLTWLERRWADAPHRLAHDVAQLAARLPDHMRAAPAANTVPWSVAQLGRMLARAARVCLPDLPRRLWPALHDAALNSAELGEAYASVSQWLRHRALASDSTVVSIARDRDPASPPALLWQLRDPDARPPRAVAAVGRGARKIAVVERSGRAVLHDRRSGDRQVVRVRRAGRADDPVTAAAACDDATWVIGTQSGVLRRCELGPANVVIAYLDPRHSGLPEHEVSALQALDGTRTAALLRCPHDSSLAWLDEIDWAEVPPARAPLQLTLDGGYAHLLALPGTAAAWGPRAVAFAGREISADLIDRDSAPGEHILDVTFDPETSSLLVATSRGGAPAVLDDELSVSTRRLGPDVPRRLVPRLLGLDSGQVVLGGSHGTMRLCAPGGGPVIDVADVTRAATRGIAAMGLRSIAIADADGWLAAAQVTRAGIDVTRRQRVSPGVARLHHLGKGHLLTVGSDGIDVRVWDADQLTPQDSAAQGPVRALAALPVRSERPVFAFGQNSRLLLMSGLGDPVIVVAADPPAAFHALAACGPSTLIARTDDLRLVTIETGDRPQATRATLGSGTRVTGLVAAPTGAPRVVLETVTGATRTSRLATWRDGCDDEIELAGRPSALALSAAGFAAYVIGTVLRIVDDDGTHVAQRDLVSGGVCLAWSGELLLIGMPDGSVWALSYRRSDGGTLRKLLAVNGAILELCPLDDELLVIRTDRDVILASTDGVTVDILSQSGGLVAAAPTEIPGAADRPAWTLAIARRAEHVTWRLVAAPGT